MKVDHFFINGKRYEISIEKEDTMSGALGRILHAKQRVFLSDKMHRETSGYTLIHEILHGISFEWLGAEKDELNEAQVNAIGAGLIAFMRENKHINLYTLIAEGLE